MKPRRILQIITKLELGGAQTHALALCRHFLEAGDDVRLACGPGGELMADARELLGGRLCVVDSLRREISPSSDIAAFSALGKLIADWKPDVAHTHSSKAGVVGRAAASKAGVPAIVHTVHGWPFHNWMPEGRRRIYVKLERWAARHATALIAVSEATKKIGLENGIGAPEQYIVAPCGIDASAFAGERDRAAARAALELGGDGPVVGTVSCFKPQKAPLDFVAAAQRIVREIPEAQFVMIGDGELRPEIEAAVIKAGLRDRFALPGWRRDVPALLAAFDVFLLTSKWEGLPLAIGEAMLSGVPVAASDVGGVSEVAINGKTGLLAAPGDIDAFCDVALRLLNHAAETERLACAAREHALSLFDNNKMFSAVEAAYSGGRS